MKKKLWLVPILSGLLICLTGCGITNALGMTTDLKPPTEAEVLAKVAAKVDKENYTYKSSQNMSSYGDVHSGYRYTFESTDRDLTFTAEGIVQHNTDGWSYYTQEIYVYYWREILKSYEDDFQVVANKYFPDVKIKAYDTIAPRIKTKEDVEKVAQMYTELNSVYHQEQIYHAKDLSNYEKYTMKPVIEVNGELYRSYTKYYAIDGGSSDITSDLYDMVCEVLLENNLSLAGFDTVEYVEETGYIKERYTDIYVDSHKMTWHESNGVPYVTKDLVVYDDDSGKYLVRLCEFKYDATGTASTSASYSTLSHYLRVIHDATGVDYYVDFVEEGNKDKIYNGGNGVTVFDYTRNGNDYKLTFTTDCSSGLTSVEATRNGVAFPVHYERAAGLGSVYVDLDDFCSLLELSYQIENATEMHFYINK